MLHHHLADVLGVAQDLHTLRSVVFISKERIVQVQCTTITFSASMHPSMVLASVINHPQMEGVEGSDEGVEGNDEGGIDDQQFYRDNLSVG